MRLIVADCDATYDGRLRAKLERGVHLIMVKSDGSVFVHADVGGYRPLNWLTAPLTFADDGDGTWTFTKADRKGTETLTVHVHAVISDADTPMSDRPMLSIDGIEADLQQQLATHPHTIEDGMTLVRREQPTAVGPVDLLCRDAAGAAVAVEVKRVVHDLNPVEQLSRYVRFLNDDPLLGPVRGILVATEFRPQALTLAADRGFGCVTVTLEQLRGLDDPTLRLFDPE